VSEHGREDGGASGRGCARARGDGGAESKIRAYCAERGMNPDDASDYARERVNFE